MCVYKWKEKHDIRWYKDRGKKLICKYALVIGLLNLCTIWFLHWTEQKYGIYNGNGDCSTSLRPVEVRLNYL